MLTRILYRAVALFFFVGTWYCISAAVACLILQLAGLRLDLIALGIWHGILACLLRGSAADAWRAARWY
jgi:hypothetical protein